MKSDGIRRLIIAEGFLLLYVSFVGRYWGYGNLNYLSNGISYKIENFVWYAIPILPVINLLLYSYKKTESQWLTGKVYYLTRRKSRLRLVTGLLWNRAIAVIVLEWMRWGTFYVVSFIKKETIRVDEIHVILKIESMYLLLLYIVALIVLLLECLIGEEIGIVTAVFLYQLGIGLDDQIAFRTQIFKPCDYGYSAWCMGARWGNEMIPWTRNMSIYISIIIVLIAGVIFAYRRKDFV